MAVTITITADAQDAIRVLQQLEGVMGDVSQEAESVGTQASGGFASAVQSAGDFIFAATNVVGAMMGVADAIGDVVDQGLRIQRAENALIAFAGGAEEAEAVLMSLQGATAGLVSDFDLMTSGARFMSMGIAESADEAAELAEIAVTLGSALGRGPNEAIEELALLIANESIPRLDTFGISAGKVRTRINELLDSGKALNRSEAFRMAVLEDAVPKVEALGGAAGVAGGNFERAKVMVENATNIIASTIASGVDTAVGWLLDLVGVVEDVIDTLGQLADFVGLDDLFAGIGDIVGGIGDIIGDVTGGIGDFLGLGGDTSLQDTLADVRAELVELGFTEVEIDTVLNDPETPERIKTLIDEGFETPAQLAVELALEDFDAGIADLDIKRATIEDILLAVRLDQPSLLSIISELARFDEWPTADIVVALQTGGLQQVIDAIEDEGYPRAEIAAILASDGLDAVKQAITDGDYDPARTTVILAEGGLQPLEDDIVRHPFTAEVDARAKTGAGEQVRDDVQAEIDADEPVVVGIVLDEVQFEEQRARLLDLGLEEVVVNALVTSDRLREIETQLQAAGAVNIELEIQEQQFEILKELIDDRIADFDIDFTLRTEGAEAAIDQLRANISTEVIAAELGIDVDEAEVASAASVANTIVINELRAGRAALPPRDIVARALGSPEEVKDAVSRFAEGLDFSVAGDFDQAGFEALVNTAVASAEIEDFELEAILDPGNLDGLVRSLRDAGVSSLELELAVSGEEEAALRRRLMDSPFAATVFVDDASVFELQDALIEAGQDVPVDLNTEAIADDLRAAGVDELAIAAFVEEESIEGIRGQLEEAGIEDVLIDVILAGGATEQAQDFADDMIAAANAAERMEEASQGISEALGAPEVTGLAKEIEDLVAPLLEGEEAILELQLGLGITTPEEETLNQIITNLEEAGATEEQVVDLALGLNAALETGQVNQELLDEINAAVEEGDFALAIDIAASFAESASAETTGADLMLLDIQAAGTEIDGWVNAADPTTLGIDESLLGMQNISAVAAETTFSQALTDMVILEEASQRVALNLEGATAGSGNGNLPQDPEQQGGFNQ